MAKTNPIISITSIITMSCLLLLKQSVVNSFHMVHIPSSATARSSTSTSIRFAFSPAYAPYAKSRHQTARFSTSQSEDPITTPPIVHLQEGLCAVHKPLNWTSNDVVSYIRGMLERDARSRGCKLAKRRSKSKNKIKVGHGGTLDPLAEGVLVLGVGGGTKILGDYLKGAKAYQATAELGYETSTLDLEGNVTARKEFDGVSEENVVEALDHFRGKIMQTPPIFSAIRVGGKRLYERAREGQTTEDVEIQAREVEVYTLEYVPDTLKGGLPHFGLDVQCGGGTYIRSLIRDIGYDVGSLATMTSLVRTKQGPFTLEHAMPKDEWSAETIYAAVERANRELLPTATDEEDDVAQ